MNLPYNRLMTDVKRARLPYRLREPFLSKTEAALFRSLTELMGARYLISPKVALSDLFTIVRPNENVHYFNKLFRKHVDFLLCEIKTFRPSFGVEIVKPILKEGMREADKYIAEVFADAGVPLVHVPSLEKYDPNDLIPLFQLALVKAGKPEDADDAVPNCPLCGKMMVLRIHRNGAHDERMYYGCIDNPHCAGAVPIP
ncbi:MAG: hypothetical protein DCC59_06660 [Chloroflexi bacterium]|nr:DUF2726 domain-containing protein [Chloroflexi bacterium CFX1]MCQ3953067.1 hypothetical protein [Chloroflexota bacterium]RIK53601.1 MAG: hypothetical protein DCC59_06660 [Chloroflexota bacterium]